MKQNKKIFCLLINSILILSIVAIFSSCNKPFAEAEAIPRKVLNPGATQTIGDMITKNENYSIYLAIVNKTPGLLAKFSDPNNELTVIAPDNDGFIRSGIPSPAVINAMPAATVAAIGMYSVIPGRQFLKSDVSGDFPNEQLPTSLSIGTVPGTPLLLQMTSFLSNGANGFWVNNNPIVTADQKFTNGVLHNPYALVAPPSQLLSDAIFSNPDLSYFKAAIARGDSGQTGTSSFGYLLGYGVTNMTVLVPDDNAFKTLLFGSVYSYLLGTGMDAASAAATATSLTSTPDVFSNPALFPVLTAATVRGILAYHFLANDKNFTPTYRAFSNNFNKTPSFYKTLVNGSIAAHPGILVTPTYTGPAVTGISFTGLGTFPPGGAAYSGTPAVAVSKDNLAVNGVYYVIDKVLLPQ